MVNTSWDFADEFMWKAMSPSHISSLPPAQGVGYLQPSTLFSSPSQLAQEEKNLEQLLRDKIGSVRMNEERLSTHWDSQLSYLLQTAVASYELERVGGVTIANTEFQQAVKGHVPEGHVFKALPV